MINFFHIAKNTFTESIREPIFFILLITALVMIGHFPSMTLFVFGDQIKLVVDSSMATVLLFGLFVAVMSSSHTVTREMRNGTVLLLLSKPVYRWTFIIAKIAGIIFTVLVFVFLCNVGSIISLYVAKDQFRMDMGAYYIYFGILIASCVFGMVMNFMYSRSFASYTTLGIWILLPIYAIACLIFKDHPEILLQSYMYALVLVFLSVSMMAAITVVFATRLDLVANLTVCSVIFFLGLISSYLFLGDTGSPVLNVICRVFYAVLPNWQFFWLADALATHKEIPASYVLWSGLYVVLYVSLCTMWAVVVFHNKEIAKDTI
jgi:ABC-type transport system involved in multi-copper enzyme maturation permease subunit